MKLKNANTLVKIFFRQFKLPMSFEVYKIGRRNKKKLVGVVYEKSNTSKFYKHASTSSLEYNQ